MAFPEGLRSDACSMGAREHAMAAETIAKDVRLRGQCRPLNQPVLLPCWPHAINDHPTHSSKLAISQRRSDLGLPAAGADRCTKACRSKGINEPSYIY
jgi:hypothetical protein